ncbi:MAG: hypothetical protein L3K26_07000, partial [Candidatus Hydrogenedentes bacterium]|nr:hypothetical protein [Candidatus Hydrogenedentota bacterium]
ATIATAARAARATHRAFYTAPPIVPHDLYPASASNCLVCHSKKGTYFGKISPRTPHPQLTNCTQCHLPSKPAFVYVEADLVETSWKGLETPTAAPRANRVIPPTMPHRKFMREDCQSCHSYQSPYTSMRTPHPQRMNCAQCHVPAADTEFTIEKARKLPVR